MITKAQAMALSVRDEVHYTGKHECTKVVGPRGGVKYNITVARVTGQCKTWKWDERKFHIGVVHGMRDYGSIDEWNNTNWHLASECPLIEGEG